MGRRVQHRYIEGSAGGMGAFRLVLICLALGCLLLSTTTSASARDLFDPVNPAAAPFQATPSRLLDADDQKTIIKIINEARSFGVPFAVRVQSVPTPQDEESTQKEADQLYANQPIESGDGADDGLLLLVLVPTADRTQTSAAFTYGSHFLPQGGITPKALDRTLNEVMIPLFKTDTVENALINGVSWVTYDQLFLSSPRLERSDAQSWLARITNIPLIPIMLLAGTAYAVVAFWVARQTRNAPAAQQSSPLTSPFAAGAIRRGRVDEAIDAAAIVRLIDTGALELRTSRKGQQDLVLDADASPGTDPFLSHLWRDLVAMAAPETGIIAAGSIRRLRDAFGPARRWQEDQLAADGYLAPRSRSMNRELLFAGLALILLAVYCMAPAIVSMDRWGLFVDGALLIEAGAIIWWSFQRSFATTAGLHAVSAWEASVNTGKARGTDDAITAAEIYALIVDQEHRLGEDEPIARRFGPGIPPLMKTLRGFSTT